MTKSRCIDACAKECVGESAFCTDEGQTMMSEGQTKLKQGMQKGSDFGIDIF
jgi:hypothetical protein